MEAIKCYKDGVDEDGVQLWSRDKGMERVLTKSMVKNGEFIVRFNKVENIFECPAGMKNLKGCPKIVNGIFQVEDSPALISLEGMPRKIQGTVSYRNSININPIEAMWYSSRDKECKYVDYWKEYHEWLQRILIDSNLPDEYIDKIFHDSNLPEQIRTKREERLNLSKSVFLLNKYNM